jgi:hypothetical protein
VRGLRLILAVPVAAGLAASLLLAQRPGPEIETPPAGLTRPVALVGDAAALRAEGLALYAAGQFPMACERFVRAADVDRTTAAWRQDIARCFEGWAWEALRGGRGPEAAVLFRQGLAAVPDDPALLKGLGIAAIHAGRPQDALEPLERVSARAPDSEVDLLLARLYERRDDPDRAVLHLNAVLGREPEHEAARRLLDKVERERHAEAGFERQVTEHFVLKYRGTHGDAAARGVLAALEAARERVGARLDYRPAERVTVVLYGDRQFHRVARVHGWVTGLFDGKIRLPLGAALPPRATLDRLVTHEYAHAAIHALSLGRAPRWLHEGLAQVLEGAPMDPMLRVPGPLTLTGLEALVADPDPLRARAGYDIALWVTRDLEQRGGMSALRALLERLGAGDPLSGAIAQAYGLRLAEIESQWAALLGG